MDIQKKIEKLSNDSIKSSNTFCYHLNSLINFLSKQINNENIEKLNSLWIIAKALSGIDIIDQCYEYFLIFKEDVENERREVMLNYNYETLVVKDCAPKTRSLIISLSENIKELYKKNDQYVNSKIDQYVKDMTKAASAHALNKDLLMRLKNV